MSPWLPKSTTAIEDRRFWQHGGVDYVGIARAAWKDITAGKVVEGGSTITQQLVRNLYTGQEKTFTRKIKEACLAIKLASKWPKSKILNEYLNTVYYGNHAYGVEAASQTYFSKHASQLTLLESALLAGLPQAPSVYDPFHNPQAALDRRDEVLRALLANHDITPAQYRRAIRSNSLGLKPGRIYTRIKQPYFFSYVIDELERQYGANTVREGGLKVYTTIDPRLQRLANKAIRDVLPYKTDPAAAIVSVEPGTGAIRAMTAVVRSTGNQFNLVAQSARQAGSTFKTFVLASAIEQGVDPDTTYYTSAPFTCSIGPWCQPPWAGAHLRERYSGSESLTRATLQSDNTVYAQLTLDVGPRYVWQMAHRLGVHLSPDKPVASIGLGSLAVSPLDMAAAYATFPAMGIYAKPMAITKVILPGDHVDNDSGWGKPQTKRVALAGRCLEGQRRAAARTRSTAPAPAPATASTSTPARRARPRTTRTPGSTATRASSRRSSGWATRRARSRCSTCTASRSPARRSRCRSGTSTWRRRSGITRCSRSSCPNKYPTWRYADARQLRQLRLVLHADDDDHDDDRPRRRRRRPPSRRRSRRRRRSRSEATAHYDDVEAPPPPPPTDHRRLRRRRSSRRRRPPSRRHLSPGQVAVARSPPAR